MTMAATEKRMLDREALRSVIQQWNANRLDLFELSEPDEVSTNIVLHIIFRIFLNSFVSISLESSISWGYAILFSRCGSKSCHKMY